MAAGQASLAQRPSNSAFTAWIGVLPRFLEGAEAPVRRAFEQALDTLAGLGAATRELDVPELTYAAMTSMMTSAAEAAANQSAMATRARPGFPAAGAPSADQWSGHHSVRSI